MRKSFYLLPLAFFLFIQLELSAQCVASWTFDDTDLTIQFTDLSTSDPGDPIVSWFWDFDDGTTSSQQNPLHTFPGPDAYNVDLEITTQNGCTDDLKIKVEICEFSASIGQGSCDANANVPLTIDIFDLYDNAGEVDVLIDGTLLPGSPFGIDQANPVSVNYDIAGDGLSHILTVQSLDIPSCNENFEFTIPDCSSNCFLSSLAVNFSGGITHTVDVGTGGNNVFTPTQVTITIGDDVDFVWVDDGHSTTSDATSGPDSWNSGVIGVGSVYTVTIQNPAVHGYYCIPHGGPGGSGMAGTIVANCPSGNQFALEVNFNTSIADPAGFDLLVDGVLDPGSPYSYNGTGPQSVMANIAGDGQSHSIEIQDVNDPSCIISTNWTAPDCGAAPSCSLSVSAMESGACDASDNVPVELTVTSINQGTSGFNVLVDGVLVPGSPFPYNPSGTTIVTVDVSGDGQSHTIEVEDADDNTCSASTNLSTTNCTIPCNITNLAASTGSSITHTVLVEDFQFSPQSITISDGDIVEWQWVGSVAHTSTSDATSGVDSWDSGLLNTPSTYQSPVLSTGIHPYYCIPHGAPGGIGMSGTITVEANCTNGEVSVLVSFNESGGSFNGFEVWVDGALATSGNYDASGSNSVPVNVLGDGQSHTIEVRDADDPSCSATTTITTPDCNAPTCQLSVSAQEAGGCDANDEVPVEVTVDDTGGGASGFELYVDGTLEGSYAYSGSGTTVVTISVSGDGTSHSIEAIDLDAPSCSDLTSLVTTDCALPCSITGLTASTGTSQTQVVLVEDFQFTPADVTVSSGDIVEWQWVGAVAHTSTSDATSGADSWDSGLLNTPSTYQSPVLSTGIHPYYCIPHGAPGGVGMAGTVTVIAPCNNGDVSVSVTFDHAGGSASGFEVWVDGSLNSSHAYDGSGTTAVNVFIVGDGQSHTIEVRDADDPSCSASTMITTPDCNAPTCQLTVSAQETGGCDANDEVPVEVTVDDTGGGASGFELYVDGTLSGSYSYSGSGTTVVTISVSGDGTSHSIEAIDLDAPSCSDLTSLVTTDCAIPCSITSLMASTGNPQTQVVLVEDFQFTPADVTISSGDVVEWQWVGSVAHTSTSDAASGPDSWDSGLLNTPSTYQSPVLSTGIHPYYCIPHGAAGGVGMAGTVTVIAPCNNGNVSVSLTFDHAGGSANGFEVWVDGSLNSSHAYDGSGTTAVNVFVVGDGQSHTIEVRDADDPSCSATTTITTPDCNAPTCQLSVSAQETGGCDANDEVPVEVTVDDTGGGASGFELYVDGTLEGSYAYSGSGTTLVTVNVPGDGALHDIEVLDIEEPTCSDLTSLTTTDCALPCNLSDLNLSISGAGFSTKHIVEVKDFEFVPKDITVNIGDTIRWEWTGVIPHTTTSDATSGDDVWDSGLLGQDESFEQIIQTTGDHPYYCIPHGAPGGVGMAGNITAVLPPPPCSENQEVELNIAFSSANTGMSGFDLFVDSVFQANYPYDPSGQNQLTINLEGDGGLHTISVEDAELSECLISDTLSLPLCGSSEPCSLDLQVGQISACDTLNQVNIDLEITATNTGDSGFELLVDGTEYPQSPFSYAPSGLTTLTIAVPGTGLDRQIEVMDLDSTNCSALLEVATPLCGPPCEILDLSVNTNGGGKHFVEVRDFEFVPANLDVLVGDTIEFFWTGVIAHTTTSDASSGPNSWNSGLLNNGAVYQLVIYEPGDHPYYCIPHGGPGGIGMAGVIHATQPCQDGQAQVTINFEVTNGSNLGYNIFLDGNLFAGPFDYDDPTGENSVVISVPGDSSLHFLTIQDQDVNFCAATTSFTAPECEILCEVQNLSAVTGGDIVNLVEVKDFEFVPSSLTTRKGETIRFFWTGQIPHTTTSDLASGPDSWDSGLLENGDTFDIILQNEGLHPYYCIPHGGPGGIGMAAWIDVLPECEDGQVSVLVNFNITNGSDSGYTVYVDGQAVDGSPFSYNDPTGTNSLFIQVPGDGSTHFITVQDAETGFCAATTTVTTADCNAGCLIAGLEAKLPENTSVTVEVADFEFIPKDISIHSGDTVHFVWTGQIPHTTTSDAMSGPDSWDSGLLGNGESYELVLQTEGSHPYYCIPHGGPGGIGMAGSILVENAGCTNGQVFADVSFQNSNTGSMGYDIYLDGVLDPDSPQAYAPDGNNAFQLSLPGDGELHMLVVADSEDPACADTLEVLTPECIVECALSASFEQVGDCTGNDEVLYDILLLHENTGSGFVLKVDDNAGVAYSYDLSGETLISLNLPGDGHVHVVELMDSDSASCVATLEITTPDCSPDCNLALTADQVAGCDDNDQLIYEVTVEALNPGNAGVHLLLDGNTVSGSPFAYTGQLTLLDLMVPGDGAVHELIIQDVELFECADTLFISVPDCAEDCSLKDLQVTYSPSQTHIVEVLDFEFLPKDITIHLGDVVRFEWVGEVPHTATSDTTSGPNSWNSGLLGQGAVFEVQITSSGFHPYYCIPHGAPGGIGMAGSITVVEDCDDGALDIAFQFEAMNAGPEGYNLLLDGALSGDSPYAYDNTAGENTLLVSLPAEGQTLPLRIEDEDNPTCALDTVIVVPDCNDPCFGFTAAFSYEIDHSNFQVNFYNETAGAVSWLWTFGTGDASVLENPVFNYPEANTYEVCLTVEGADGCSDQYCEMITVGEYLCEAAFSFETDGLTIQLTDESITSESVTNWSWNMGNGNLLVGQSAPNYTYDTLGIYEICLSIDAGACKDDTCIVVDLSNPCLLFQPDFAFNVNAGELSAQFIDLTTGNPNQWLWGFGDGNTSNEQNPEHFFDEPGYFNVCLLVQDTALGCNRSRCKVVNVGTTAMQEPLNRNFHLLIFPNPVLQGNPFWTIAGIHEEDYRKELKMKLYNAQGKTVFHGLVRGDARIELQPSHSLGSGIYFLEFQSDQRIYRGKLVIQ